MRLNIGHWKYRWLITVWFCILKYPYSFSNLTQGIQWTRTVYVYIFICFALVLWLFAVYILMIKGIMVLHLIECDSFSRSILFRINSFKIPKLPSVSHKKSNEAHYLVRWCRLVLTIPEKRSLVLNWISHMLILCHIYVYVDSVLLLHLKEKDSSDLLFFW